MNIDSNINKDLILREKLALERTQMANDRTLLSFLRTSLYFAVGSLSINNFLKLKYGFLFQISLGITCFLILILGVYKYKQTQIKIEDYKKHIGDYKLYE